MRKANISRDYSLLETVNEVDVLLYYFDEIVSIPCLISCPYRSDNHPSLSISLRDSKVVFHDFATGESGGLYKLLALTYNKPVNDMKDITVDRINDIQTELERTDRYVPVSESRTTEIKIKKRDWNANDIAFWHSFGIDIDMIARCNVYPISHFFINDCQYTADRYAYAYFEYKEERPTFKIYQPFNKRGFKWRNNHDKSVISLWRKMPESGDILFICSSVKDALCLTCNTKYPAIALQSENCTISESALKVIKSKFKNIYILLDNDDAGMMNSIRLSNETGLKYLKLPKINDTKDISDMYRSLDDKSEFKTIIDNLIKYQ